MFPCHTSLLYSLYSLLYYAHPMNQLLATLVLRPSLTECFLCAGWMSLDGVDKMFMKFFVIIFLITITKCNYKENLLHISWEYRKPKHMKFSLLTMKRTTLWKLFCNVFCGSGWALCHQGYPGLGWGCRVGKPGTGRWGLGKMLLRCILGIKPY